MVIWVIVEIEHSIYVILDTAVPADIVYITSPLLKWPKNSA